MRFVADAHLGGLAHMLRMAGFDTRYDNHFDDHDIVAIAEEEGRIVLTRDRELLKHRGITHGSYVHALKPQLQFREIVERLDLARSFRPFTRCLECNAPLREADKQEVADCLPPSVREHHHCFKRCDVCGRVFWEGSHWQRMRKVLDWAGGGAPCVNSSARRI